MILRATLLAILLTTPVLAGPGDWTRRESTRGVAYFVESETGDLTSGGHPNGTNLMLSCFEDSLGIGLFLPLTMDGQPVAVSFMLDGRQPWQENWAGQEKYPFLIGLWDGAAAKTFIDRIGPGQRLTVQLMLRDRPATYSYDLTQAAGPVDELIMLCGASAQ